MREIVRVVIILSSLIFGGYSMGDPPLPELFNRDNLSLTIMPYFEAHRHKANGISVWKLHQEEYQDSDFPFFSPPPCNPEIPDQLTKLSKELNAETKQNFKEYLAEALPTDYFFIQIAEHILTNSLIKEINASPAQFVILMTTNKESTLSRFSNAIKKFDSRIKVALSDRTVSGINTDGIEKLLANPFCNKLYYLALHHLDDNDAYKIAACENLKNLVGLSVERSHITGSGLLRLGESQNLPSLKIFSVDLRALLINLHIDFIVRMAPFQARLYRYEWVGFII